VIVESHKKVDFLSYLKSAFEKLHGCASEAWILRRLFAILLAIKQATFCHYW